MAVLTDNEIVEFLTPYYKRVQANEISFLEFTKELDHLTREEHDAIVNYLILHPTNRPWEK